MSVDPGENVGVATFREDGTDIAKQIMNLEEFRKFLNNSYIATSSEAHYRLQFILEDYRLRQDKAIDQTGSNMPASRCIGAVEQINTMLGKQSNIFWQNPSDLRGALKWAGYAHLANKPRTYHVRDDISAYAHGVHRLITLNLKRHPIFDAE